MEGSCRREESDALEEALATALEGICTPAEEICEQGEGILWA